MELDYRGDAIGYAMDLANDSYGWYSRAAIRSRRGYKLSETASPLGATAAVPISAVILAQYSRCQQIF